MLKLCLANTMSDRNAPLVVIDVVALRFYLMCIVEQYASACPIRITEFIGLGLEVPRDIIVFDTRMLSWTGLTTTSLVVEISVQISTG